ncbi:MAG: MFS transporter, partial [Chloroflexota bacterium]|nr:MFS transporter [Chloroflexota bacterium]
MVTQTERDCPRRGLGPEFRKLWAASAVSNLGDGVALVAAPLLAAALTRDPALVAGLAVAQQLPWLLFALLSGALADRLDRRRAMAAVGAGRAALIGALGIAVLLDHANLPLLYAVFFLLGVGETLFDTTAATVLPAVVPREQLPRANARLSGIATVTNHFIGKPLGGLLFAAAAALPFLLGAG